MSEMSAYERALARFVCGEELSEAFRAEEVEASQVAWWMKHHPERLARAVEMRAEVKAMRRMGWKRWGRM